MGIAALGAPWALFIRKGGTVGQYAYTFNTFWGITLMAILCAGAKDSPHDVMCFNIAIPWTIVMLIYHPIATGMARKKGANIHTRHIGRPVFSRFGDKFGYVWEMILGISIGALAAMAGVPIFGAFVMASALCAFMYYGMIDSRDRQRAMQIMDAKLEQTRLMEMYGELERQDQGFN